MKNLTFEQRRQKENELLVKEFRATKRQWRRAARLNGYRPTERRI